MTEIPRREFMRRATAGAFAAAAPVRITLAQAPRKMTMSLSGGAIGVSGNQREAVDLAAKYGFESVEAYNSYLASLNDEQMAELKAYMKSKGIMLGYGGLPVDFRRDDATFAAGMKQLPLAAAGLKRAGVTRIASPQSCNAAARPPPG